MPTLVASNGEENREEHFAIYHGGTRAASQANAFAKAALMSTFQTAHDSDNHKNVT